MVRKAVKALPKEFKDKLENVDIVIEDGEKGNLLGLYQGIPRKYRASDYGMVLPDKITLFRRSIEEECFRRGLDLYEEIKHVIQHEIAHHFGISDKRLRDLDIY